MDTGQFHELYLLHDTSGHTVPLILQISTGVNNASTGGQNIGKHYHTAGIIKGMEDDDSCKKPEVKNLVTLPL
jgi:hypothetical protein